MHIYFTKLDTLLQILLSFITSQTNMTIFTAATI
jgi:hypothetical protein